MVKVEVEAPDGIVDFLKAFNINVKEYLEEAAQTQFGCDWGAFEGDPSIFIDVNKLIEKYELDYTPPLKDYIKKGEVKNRNDGGRAPLPVLRLLDR